MKYFAITALLFLASNSVFGHKIKSKNDENLYEKVCNQTITQSDADWNIVNWFGVIGGITGAIGAEIPGIDIVIGILDNIKVS